MILGPIRAHNPNGVSIGSVFTQLTAQGAYSLQWAALPPQNCPFPWGIWTSYNTWFLGPPESSTQTASWSVQPFLQGSQLWQTNRPTDRQTYRPCYPVGNNRPHLRTYSTVSLRCSLKQGKTINLFTYLFTSNAGVAKITGKEHYILQCSQIM